MSFPSTVEAITVPQPGAVEVLEKRTWPFPKVEPNHIVIKIEYLGINFIDTYFRSGLYPLKQYPAILGKEAAGRIVALPTDPAVLNDPVFKSQGFDVGSKVAVEYDATHATYISIPWTKAQPVPQEVSTLTAAAGLLQALTAVTFTDEAYNIKKGDTILVHTVAGGLGLLLAQIGKLRGATVIGTTSNAEKAALAKASGADHVILYPVEDTVQRVLEITNGEGVHAIFDGVGKDTFDKNFKMIRRKGTIVSYGNASGPVPPFPLLKLVEKNVVLVRPTMSNYVYTHEEHRHYGHKVFDLIASGALKIQVHKEYPFTAEGVQQAQRDLVGGKTTGKLVVKVTDE
ncbi:NAD(P)-binding protein [Pluteus cervinus]|uniref:NAD(P)-binding protein n=1 Tax=Pluteus cervinus TaxID=181527 RepID=A0ACD3ASH1_9AGAR|nr:NAD(P)-binding protein [Pluteus cervinus]